MAYRFPIAIADARLEEIQPKDYSLTSCLCHGLEDGLARLKPRLVWRGIVDFQDNIVPGYDRRAMHLRCRQFCERGAQIRLHSIVHRKLPQNVQRAFLIRRREPKPRERSAGFLNSRKI